MKMASTQLKIAEFDRVKDSKDRLSTNKTNLANTFTNVEAGRDNRWNVIHSARYLPGAGVSAMKMWVNARRTIGLKGYLPIGNYDMSTIGLAGVVTAKGWLEIYNPSSTDLKLKLFNINSVSSSSKYKEDDDFSELADLKLAMRALKAAMKHVMPWNFSIDALDGFLEQTFYCHAETAQLEKRAQVLTQFIDYVLGQNAELWRDEQPFMTCGDLKAAWASFFGLRGRSAPKKKEKETKRPPQKKSIGHKGDGVCWNFNEGRCLKAAGDCKTCSGRELKHICNYIPDKSKPEEMCGKDHMRVKFH